MQPVMITVAMVGAEVTRDAQPNLPTTPQEIVAAAVECYEAGASIIHIHVRDAEGNATQDGNLFREVVEGIRACCDVIRTGNSYCTIVGVRKMTNSFFCLACALPWKSFPSSGMSPNSGILRMFLALLFWIRPPIT